MWTTRAMRIYSPHCQGSGKVMFSVCLSVQEEYPASCPKSFQGVLQPLVPGSFQGVAPGPVQSPVLGPGGGGGGLHQDRIGVFRRKQISFVYYIIRGDSMTKWLFSSFLFIFFANRPRKLLGTLIIYCWDFSLRINIHTQPNEQRIRFNQFLKITLWSHNDLFNEKIIDNIIHIDPLMLANFWLILKNQYWSVTNDHNYWMIYWVN